MLDHELAAFIESPVMQIIGTADADRRPEVGRGVGAWPLDGRRMALVVSGWQWPGTIANLRENGMVAVTFSRPADYVTYQIKGKAEVRDAAADEIDRSERYMVAMVSALMRLGLAPDIIAPWLSHRDARLVTIDVASVFVQTPGAKAGSRLRSVST